MALCGLFVISTCVTTLHLCDMIMHLFSANQMHLIFSCTLLASKSQELNIDSTLYDNAGKLKVYIAQTFKPKVWPACNFSLHEYFSINHKDGENKGNDH